MPSILLKSLILALFTKLLSSRFLSPPPPALLLYAPKLTLSVDGGNAFTCLRDRVTSGRWHLWCSKNTYDFDAARGEPGAQAIVR